MKLKHDDGKGTRVYIEEDGSEFVIYYNARPHKWRRINTKKQGSDQPPCPMKGNIKMKTLPLKTRKNDFDYDQVIRGRRYAIYRQTVSQNEHYYELFEIRIRPERELDGELLEAREAFPHNEAFGYWASVYPSLQEALTAMYEKSGIKYHWIP